MPANFVVLFGSKVGSTAIVSSLSAQKGIRVPLLEEFDEYQFAKTNGDLYAQMRQVFNTGEFGDERPTAGLQRSEEISTVGFKWRFWGQRATACELFKECNVRVFVLTRRNFLEHCCAFYQQAHGAKHLLTGDYTVNPQFVYNTVEDPENDPAVAALRNQTFSVDPSDFANAISYMLHRIKKYSAIVKACAKHGVPTYPIFYEDFDADPQGFIQQFQQDIDINPPADFNPYCAFSKTHKKPNSARMIGLDELLAKPNYAAFFNQSKAKYHALQDEIAALSQ